MTDVYVDMLFLIDFTMDYACLLMCRLALGIPGKNVRIAIAAAVGGAYSVASLFLPGGVIGVLAAILALFAVSAAAFYRKGDSLSRLFKITLTYLGINALLGGTVSAVFGLFGRLGDVVLPDVSVERVSTAERILYLSLAAGCLLAHLTVSRIRNNKIGRIKQIRICFAGKDILLDAIPDSGNLLTEPLSGRPCIFIGARALQSLLGREGAAEFLSVLAGDVPRLGGGILLIPAKTVGGSALLPGFYPEKTELIDEEGKSVREVGVAVAVERENAIKAGSALLPESVL